ncbi:MAG: stage II sporulation protein D, partial [Methylocystaceae bacterium]
VGAEMPASFGSEALKAQAVTARTYTLKRLYAPAKHPRGAQMCDDIRCCQAYIDPQKYRQEFGNSWYEARFVPVRRAVVATRSQIMLYKNQLIDTPYFSTCGGKTASASEVWGREVPYLQSVPCSYCQNSKRYNNQITISLKQVNQVLKEPEHKHFQLRSKVVTASGRLRSAVVNGRPISGTKLRQLFGLPSTQITAVNQQGNQVTFECRGYGHGVGLCQYGAAGMGQENYKYQQILQHYYQGIKVVKLNY